MEKLFDMGDRPMEKIKDAEFGGERPLFAKEGIELENVTIHAGESALKRCADVVARHCRFEGKYPFWHCDRFVVEDCDFTEGARAALWYSDGCHMVNCRIDAPKMFRQMTGIWVERTNFPNGQEMLWDCDDVTLRDVRIDNCDYLFSHTDNIDIDRYEQHGNYTFQYGHNATIRNAKIFSKDAFWNTSNFTIIDSELHGEYLAWYSTGLTLINCHISGTQPLCYCSDLTLINCTFDPDCDLCFEESDVKADVASHITSVKNPCSGVIKAKSIGELIIDEHALPGSDCKIITAEQ